MTVFDAAFSTLIAGFHGGDDNAIWAVQDANMNVGVWESPGANSGQPLVVLRA